MGCLEDTGDAGGYDSVTQGIGHAWNFSMSALAPQHRTAEGVRTKRQKDKTSSGSGDEKRQTWKCFQLEWLAK